MSKIVVCVGISGSGKSTWCTDYIERNFDYVRVNRDAIRMQITGSDKRMLSKELETLVTKIQDEQVKTMLNEGMNVILDNTHLQKKYIDEIIAKYNHLADIQFKLFPVDPELAYIRVRTRDVNPNPNYVYKQESQYKVLMSKGLDNVTMKKVNEVVIQDDNLPSCILCDLDGTLSLYSDKNSYERDFENDEINQAVLEVVMSQINEGSRIFFFSGRNGKFKPQTIEFLERCGFDRKDYTLIMREDGDFRRDSIVKLEMFDNYIRGKMYCEFVLDDRLQVIEECWRKLGLFVFNCNQNMKRF